MSIWEFLLLLKNHFESTFCLKFSYLLLSEKVDKDIWALVSMEQNEKVKQRVWSYVDIIYHKMVGHAIPPSINTASTIQLFQFLEHGKFFSLWGPLSLIFFLFGLFCLKFSRTIPSHLLRLNSKHSSSISTLQVATKLLPSKVSIDYHYLSDSQQI